MSRPAIQIVKRSLAALSSTTFDVLIIGGGATGACAARDAARRGLSVALIEKGDFCGATSAGSSKMMHGGLRYLKSGEVTLVRESLRERRIWMRIAPHLVRPLPFLLPAYSRAEELSTRLGLTLYDALSFDRNAGVPYSHRSKSSTWLSKAETLEREPVVERAGLRGATLYTDAQMQPERIVVACLHDAVTHGAVVANYVAASSFERAGTRIATIHAVDQLSGDTFPIRAQSVVNATGPWADLLLAAALGGPSPHQLTRSKGIHVVLPPITRGHALTLSHAGGHFFVLPWAGRTLIGTTDTAFAGNPADVQVTAADVSALLSTVNQTLPNASALPEHVCFAYAALRPLVASGTGDTYRMSRRGEVINHADDGVLTNMISALGGKWTTSRATAERCIDLVAQKLNRRIKPCTTADEPLPDLEGSEDRVRQAFAAEMAMTVEDVVLRRLPDSISHPPLSSIADQGAAALGWSVHERERQIAQASDALRRHFSR